MARAAFIIEALEMQDRSSANLDTARLRRSLRLRAKALELSDEEFRAHYSLSKEVFLDLCSELAPLLSRPRRRTKVAAETKILTALSFFASGSYQKPVGMSFLHGLSQSSVSNAIKEVTAALNDHNVLRKYIKFPKTSHERQLIINGFSDKFGFPGILGCIDGTHIALVRPTEHEERFFNRKHYHSRNVQIICDSDLNILNIDATFGGATHDAHIWKTSEINMHMQQLHRNGEVVWFLGDSGYPLRPWLLTPIVNAELNSPHEHYTNLHCRVRNTVERCIGVLKARWRCLLTHRVLHYDHHTVAKIINACSVLHNIANHHRIPPPELSVEEVHQDSILQVPRLLPVDRINENEHLERGRRHRDVIVQRLWRNRSNS